MVDTMSADVMDEYHENVDRGQLNMSRKKNKYSSLTEEQREDRRAYAKQYYRRQCASRELEKDSQSGRVSFILCVCDVIIFLWPIYM